jgi:hypothetical protein
MGVLRGGKEEENRREAGREREESKREAIGKKDESKRKQEESKRNTIHYSNVTM